MSRGPAPVALNADTVRQALAFAAGQEAPGPATLLAEGMLLAAALSRLKAVAAMLLLGVGLFAAAGVLAQSKPSSMVKLAPRRMFCGATLVPVIVTWPLPTSPCLSLTVRVTRYLPSSSGVKRNVPRPAARRTPRR
jgi:hypothetical protein